MTMNGHDGAQLPPPQVPAEPVLTNVIVAAGRVGAEPVVILIIDTPVGRSQFFLDVDQADKLADGLTAAVRQGRTGLIVAKDVPVGPPTHHGRVTDPGRRAGGSSGHGLSGG